MKQKIRKFLSKFKRTYGLRFIDSIHLKRERKIDFFLFCDYVRLSTLELITEEIKNNRIGGSTAEVGVFQGEFSKHINKLLPDRNLYLIDTFQGFVKSEFNSDKNKGFVDHYRDFSDTSIELVLSKMEFEDKCKIIKGKFPECLEGQKIDDSFALVSIDLDLCEPTLSALRYFYPKLSKGGYIFLHDYNNPIFEGVKKAFKEFSAENEDSLIYVPLTDFSGSIIISK